MPRWVSVNGEWKPAKETVALVNRSDKEKVIDGKVVAPGEPYIYKGADRAALYQLYEEKVEKLGIHFKTDPQMIEVVRKLGFSNMDEYIKFVGVDVEAEGKKNEEILSVKVSKHELPKRVQEIEVMSGGTETSTGEVIRKGGWDKPKDM